MCRKEDYRTNVDSKIMNQQEAINKCPFSFCYQSPREVGKETSKTTQSWKYFPLSHRLYLALSVPFLLTYDPVETLITTH